MVDEKKNGGGMVVFRCFCLWFGIYAVILHDFCVLFAVFCLDAAANGFI